MDVNQILKWAFVASVAVYAVVAMVVAGPPRWDSPWLPADPTHRVLLMVLVFIGAGTWTAGWIVGHIKEPPVRSAHELVVQRPPLFARQRFILAAALIEAGAIYGLVLSLVIKDSRYAIAFSVPAAVLLILTPVGENGLGGPPPGSGA
jgi:F0F1-type ATP synthase membrane subunit c/vacuolar-type H+-ATPase subunit K